MQHMLLQLNSGNMTIWARRGKISKFISKHASVLKNCSMRKSSVYLSASLQENRSHIAIIFLNSETGDQHN